MFEIGATLREARVRKRLTLRQVEEDTKIRGKYLQALEDEEFDVLPGRAYAKGFLTSYASYLGLDPQTMLDEFNSRHAAEDDPLAGPSALRRPARSRRTSGLVFFAVVAVLVLAAVYLLGLRGGGEEETPARVVPSALTPSPTTTPSPSAASPSPSQTADRTTVNVEVVGPSCYYEVFFGNLDGEARYADTAPQGDSQTYRSKRAVYVRVGGDPASLAIQVNGKKIRTSGDASGVVYVIKKGRVTRQ